MSRELDANFILNGGEPNFKGVPPEVIKADAKMILVRTLSWYASNSSEKDSAAWLKKAYPKAKFDNASNIGFLCRMVARGFPSELVQSRIDQKLALFALTYREQKETKEETKVAKVAKPDITKSDDQVDEIITELELVVDDFLTEKKSSRKISTSNLKPAQIKEIREYLDKMIALNTGCAGKEGYDNISSRMEKALLFYLSKIADQLSAAVPEKIKKPRVKKQVPIEKIVGKYRFSDWGEFKSIAPVKLHKTEMAMLFDSSTRMLHLFISESDKALEIEGVNLVNADATKSFCKRLRKPEEQLADMLKGTKAAVLKKFDTIKSVAYPSKKRSTETNVILKVW